MHESRGFGSVGHTSTGFGVSKHNGGHFLGDAPLNQVFNVAHLNVGTVVGNNTSNLAQHIHLVATEARLIMSNRLCEECGPVHSLCVVDVASHENILPLVEIESAVRCYFSF